MYIYIYIYIYIYVHNLYVHIYKRTTALTPPPPAYFARRLARRLRFVGFVGERATGARGGRGNVSAGKKRKKVTHKHTALVRALCPGTLRAGLLRVA